MDTVPFPLIREQIAAIYPELFMPVLEAYARQHGLSLHALPEVRLLNRGYCYSGVFGCFPHSDGSYEEHQFLTIPQRGGIVPEKRHFRLLPNPNAPDDPWVILGEEYVTLLCGVLTIYGTDVKEPQRIKAGERVISYGCYLDRIRQTIHWFQDRHALRADEVWTAMIFCHRYRPLSFFEEVLGVDHPELCALRARGITIPGAETAEAGEG
ncbi:MAG: hypothetical protein D6736_16805 [Nitrospinota bacterium]|nr:MAG: hypothetical protein D6736_16805 [Nitrospinota bacterium]